MKDEKLVRYVDLMARVRGDNQLHSITELVQPDDPEVKEIASILMGAVDFVAACQDFVHSFTLYRREIGDYWATPAETMAPLCPKCMSAQVSPVNGDGSIYQCASCGWTGEPIRAGDCDDKAILLASLLRNRYPAEDVFCAIGIHSNTRSEGHMWVEMDEYGKNRIIEATAPSTVTPHGQYNTMAIFNDRYAFSYFDGLKEFNLLPVLEEIYA